MTTRLFFLLSWLWLPITTAAATPLPNAGEFDCIIEPAQVVEIRSPVVGLIQEVHAKRGQSISRGQVLVTIESSVEQSAAAATRFRGEAQGALLSARNKVTAAREKARRMTELYEQQFVSAQARDDAVAEMLLAESEMKSAEESSQLAKLEHRQSVDQINRRVLRSPFNGVVVDQYLYPGALVDPSEGKKPILKVAQTRPLSVHAILPFRYFPQVKAGVQAVVSPEAPFTREIIAPVHTVDRVIDSAAGTFGVVVHLDNSKHELPSGIRCKLRISGLK